MPKRQLRTGMLIVLGLTGFFVALAALVLWPMGQVQLAFSLAQGYGVLWAAVWASAVLLSLVERILGVDPDEHHTAYLAVLC